MKKLIAAALALVASTQWVFADGMTPQPTQGSSLPSLLMLVVFVLVFYFLLIRPQMKRSKEQRQLMGALEKGDEVVTASGMYGRVVKLDDTSLDLEIAEQVIVKMQKQSVVSLLPKGTVKLGALKEESLPAVPAKKAAPAKKKTAKKKEA